MKRTRKRLGDLLVEANLITESQLQSTLKDKSDSQKLGDALLQQGHITEQQLIEVLEFQLGIPHISLYRYPFDQHLFTLVPKERAKRHMLIPLKREGEKLFVAMADPMDYFAIDDLRLTTGFQIEPAIATKDDILRAINKYYNMDDEFKDLLMSSEEEIKEEANGDIQDSPIIRLVNQVISNAVVAKASDIHFDPQETKLIIRYRIDGLLRTERILPKHMQSMITARIKILANLDITEYRVPQDGRMKYRVDIQPVDLRVSTLPTVFGEKIVMRILDLSSSLNDISKLGFNSYHQKLFNTMLQKPNGIVLITGPTGSGKSSTLYAALNKLNSENVNILTIEDPVEYQIEGINQIQVNTQTGMDFAAGLRSILRQDPNIIMVGEIRDKDTVEVAIRASLTGHLVLSTLHTNDSIGTITRLMDMGVEPFLVASSLNGIVSQRLVRKVCRDCKEEHAATKREVEIFSRRGIKIEKIVRGKGCSSCNMTGYKGRIAIHEVLVMNDELRKVIMNGESFMRLREIAEQNKTIFLLDDGLLKVKQGITTTEEVLRVTIPE
ncbi:GspE/PulE family protein [Niallia nealsonii]|uniref:Type II secretion system protein GspE n=1 Tax=Niallia nealsonii TaxID=115979 RepID=A0A2N0YWP8_9BACI|nr:ATPase, T2SS/T4P/T4SS family [Niallia nealsonii]PKG21684.1 type II secretion system protein GspE [Niallia nealsonii]